MDLHGKVALVTGGARGIGRAVVHRLAEAGAAVAINFHHSKDEAEALASHLHGSRCYQADVSDAASAEQLIAAVEKDFGGLDILVNNAGISLERFLMMTSASQWEEVINANVTSVFHCSRLASKIMIKNKWGRIINLSSIHAVQGTPGNTAYAASKAAIIGFTKSLAAELGRYNVLVNALLPGLIETDMLRNANQRYIREAIQHVPLQRTGQPDDVAHLAVFLATEKAAYITGQSFIIDGGLSC